LLELLNFFKKNGCWHSGKNLVAFYKVIDT